MVGAGHPGAFHGRERDAMPTLNYRQIPTALERLQPFEGNSMSAAWMNPQHVHMGRLDEDERREVREVLDYAEATGQQAYVVFSRVTPIAVILPDSLRYVVRQRFSVTTSRQQNLCRAYLPALPDRVGL